MSRFTATSRAWVPALVLAACMALVPPAAATDDNDGADAAVAAGAVVPDEVVVRMRGRATEQVVEVRTGETLARALTRLRRNPNVRWAEPNAIARASWMPRDPGRAKRPGGWVEDQWNFLTPPPAGAECTRAQPCGVDAPRAWRLLRKAGRPRGRKPSGKRGPIVAVVDSGVAFRNKGKRFRKSPDLARDAFVRGKDFISGGPPLDRNGHGTHVASTIVERTDNNRGVAGLADGLRVMPVRVLDAAGSGSARNVARGIRYAARNGARVINLSLNFGPQFNGCDGLRAVCAAIRTARRSGVLVVAAAGNENMQRAQMPALRSTAVAAGTVRGCLSAPSNFGKGIDLTAPGGGRDKKDAGPHCVPELHGPGIVQLTLRAPWRMRSFGYPRYEGTSMAATHVSAAAGLVLSSRVLQRKLGRKPMPADLEAWLACTARPVPAAGGGGSSDGRYGAGLLDLGAALDPASACPRLGLT